MRAGLATGLKLELPRLVRAMERVIPNVPVGLNLHSFDWRIFQQLGLKLSTARNEN